jgi:hypothetical protein
MFPYRTNSSKRIGRVDAIETMCADRAHTNGGFLKRDRRAAPSFTFFREPRGRPV